MNALKLVPGLAVGTILLVFAIYALMVVGGMAAEPCSRPLVLVSWYGLETCHGKPPGHGPRTCHTASDVPFDGSQWLVANKGLPMGTRVRFTFNGRSVVAPVRDRGPYIRGRVFDLSHAVAKALGMTGVQRVCAEILP